MKLRSMLTIAFDSCMTKKKNVVVNVIIMVIMLLLISGVSTLYIQTDFYKNSLKKALPTTVDKIGYVNVGRADEELVGEQINNIEGVEAVASWNYMINTIKGFEIFSDIQAGQESGTFLEYGTGVEVITMSGDWEFYNWDLMEGDKPDSTLLDDYTTLVYVGAKYKDIVKVGDVIEDKANDEITFRYIISGIFEEDSLIAYEDMWRWDSGSINGDYSLDYSIVEVYGGNGSLLYFSVDESHDINNIVDEIYELSEESEYTPVVSTIETTLKELDQFNAKVKEYTLELILVIVLTTFVMIVCSQVISILSESKIYGIWYSNGATTSELLRVLLFENIIKATIAIILSLTCVNYIVEGLVSIETAKSALSGAFTTTIFVEIIVVGYAVAILSSIIPMIIFAKKTPVSMLGGE